MAGIERLITSPFALNIVTAIAKAAPPGLGYPVASMVARWIFSHPDSGPVRAIRSNQRVVAGNNTLPRDLDQATRAVLQNSARSTYELYHYIQRRGAIGQIYSIDASFQTIFERPEFDGAGLVLAGLHMVGFDLGLQWLCMDHFKPLVLTIPSPQGGRRMEFETRRQSGVNIVPGSVKGLLQAIRHLQRGGMVVTGIDRPVPNPDPRPRFFGRPAALPTHHVFLALKTHAPIVVVVSRLEEDGKHHILASPPIDMDPYPDRADELLFNAEKVLSVAEGFIRQTPLQWLISLPVWPDIINDVPG
jgi:KDO2-lipid IV(A) lauroyltransferase